MQHGGAQKQALPGYGFASVHCKSKTNPAGRTEASAPTGWVRIRMGTGLIGAGGTAVGRAGIDICGVRGDGWDWGDRESPLLIRI